MNRINRIVILLLLVALVLSACQPIQAPGANDKTEPVAVAHTPREDAPTYGMRGPYAVGVRDFVVEGKEGERAIPVSVWYPAQNPEGLPEEITYVLDYNNPQWPDYTIAGSALRDAKPDFSGGPYPLVVFSHGYWSFRQWSVWLTEHLASHGFVVIAGDHHDNMAYAFGDSQVDSYVYRPLEVRREIDFAAELTAANGPLAGLFDAAHVGVVGHSLGADTALLAGGARFNSDHYLNEWCAANPGDPDDWANDCANLPRFLDEMAALAGLEEVPEGIWPDMGDPRVAAVVSLASAANMFGPEGLAELNVPVLLVESELDWSAGAINALYHPYSLLPPENKTHVLFERADHGISLNACAATPGLVEGGFGTWCIDSVWDMNRAHDLLNHFVVSFFLAELKGDTAAAAALAPENVVFPGIQYETTGIGTPSAAAPILDDATVAKIDAIVEKAMTDYPSPGFEMCVVKDGQVVYNKGFGLADVDGKRPMTPSTVSTEYSISKSMTAMALMQLVEQGKVDLDAPATQYLPYFTMADPRYKEITARMLLNHTSGMADDPWGFELAADIDPLEQAVRSLHDKQLLDAPGAAWSYSNVGYAVLGDLIAKVIGEPFPAYMQQHLLQPMGMIHSTFAPAEVDPALQALGYVDAEDGGVKVGAPEPDPRNAPADGLHSSCEDMVKWATVMLNQGKVGETQVLAPESIEAMWANGEATPWPDLLGPHYGAPFQTYGLGWYTGAADGHRLVGNAGAGDGFNTQLQLAPDDGLAVIAMDNWLVDATADWYPASFAAVDVLYALLGINPE